jgi:hypothetical protein
MECGDSIFNSGGSGAGGNGGGGGNGDGDNNGGGSQPELSPDPQSPGTGTCGTGYYSPHCPGWHFYTLTSLVCPAELHCSVQEMIDYLSRFAYPGQYPSNPVHNTDLHPVGLGPFSFGWLVLGPYSMGPLGQVQTFVSNGGLTVKNVTQPGHIFHDGIIIRTAYQENDAWYVSTYGYGNNVNVGMDTANQVFGPGIFNALNQQMINTIEAHH